MHVRVSRNQIAWIGRLEQGLKDHRDILTRMALQFSR